MSSKAAVAFFCILSPLKTGPLLCFEMVGDKYPLNRRSITEELTFQPYRCKNNPTNSRVKVERSHSFRAEGRTGCFEKHVMTTS